MNLAERISLTPREAAAATGIPLTAIQAAYLSGDLPVHYRSERRPVIFVEDLKAWIAAAPTERTA